MWLTRQLDRLYYDNFYLPTWVGAFINPYFIVRRGISRALRQHRNVVRGELLDYGCGSRPYESLFHVTRYVGVDVAVSGHDHARSRVDVFFDGSTLPFADQSFDSILCTGVLEHVPDPARALAEMQRVARPGARLLLTMPFLWGEHETPYDFTRFTTFGLRALLERHGWRVTVCEKTGTGGEAALQLWNVYWFESVIVRFFPRYFRPLGVLVFLAPVHLAAALVKHVLPRNENLFLNLVIVAERAG
jgi:SAM-dependent methyltransferase